MDYNLTAFLLLSLLVLGIGLFVSQRKQTLFPARLIMAALALRIVGSLARYEVLERYYHGVGDAKGYYGYGLSFARTLWSGDLSVLGYHQWFVKHLGGGPGTQFMKNVSGLVVSVVGPSLRAEFLVFSLLSFLGLYLIAVAFARMTDLAEAKRLALFIWLWPSLWFWPSSVGKEAIVVLGLGLVFYGFAGRRGKYGLFSLAAGLFVLFMVRAHVAFLVAACMGAAHWVVSFQRFNLRRVLEGMAIGVAVIFVLMVAWGRVGLGDADLEGVEEFVNYRTQATQQGGGAIEEAPQGILAPVAAVVNIWMRPFPWEVHNATALLAASETLLFWFLMVGHLRPLGLAIRKWRRDRLLAFIVMLVSGYTLMIGITFANLGIIARQRAPMFAFFFMLPLAVARIVPMRSIRDVEDRRESLASAADIRPA